MPCNCCEITDHAFNEADARADLRSYRKRGPARHTRELLNAVRSQRLKDATLLDIGGGVGVIHHELIGDPVVHATHVDASAAYLREAQSEAAQRGHLHQLEFIHADFTDVASSLPSADIVTLDRVVCCYPHFRLLLTAAAAHSNHLLALSYPRETWYMRLGLWIIDFFQSLRRDPFRVFLHPIADMDALLRSAGMQPVSLKRLFVWEIALYRRDIP